LFVLKDFDETFEAQIFEQFGSMPNSNFSVGNIK